MSDSLHKPGDSGESLAPQDVELLALEESPQKLPGVAPPGSRAAPSSKSVQATPPSTQSAHATPPSTQTVHPGAPSTQSAQPVAPLPPMPMPAEPPDPRIGRLFSKYRIDHAIGKGAMGFVYEAEDTVLNRQVAIKFLPDSHKENQKSIERFITEAQVAGRLNHPNIISIHDIGQDSGRYYIVMELLNPRSSGGFVKAHGPLHWTEATQVMADCCAALQAAHQIGLVHRDIKPDNILCSATGSAKLVDFGLVKDLEVLAAEQTQSGLIAGTPLYMSPEQCTEKPVDARTDLYSLGATFHTLLTGYPPYHSSPIPQIMMQHVASPTPDPRKLVPEIPDDCARILMRAMQKDPALRYQSAQEMRADLLETLKSASIPPFKFLISEEPGRLRQLPRRDAPKAISTLSSQSQSYPYHSEEGPPAAGFDLAIVPQLRGAPRFWQWFFIVVPLLLVGAVVALFINARLQISRNKSRVVGQGPIRVGILQSLSGAAALSGRPLVDASLLAVDEINEHGGLLGRKLEAVVADARSDNDTFAKEAERLIVQEKVAVLFGGWTVSNRRAIKPVVERHEHLLIYPARHEGLEDSRFIIYNGEVPNQQVLPALHYCIETLRAKRIFLIGTDGLYARISHAVIQDALRIQKDKVKLVGEEYVLVGEADFKSSVRKIKKAKPDVILNFINGDSNQAFFHALREGKITPDTVPTISFSVSETELAYMQDVSMEGDYLAWSYFETVDRPQNRAFVKLFQAKFGEDRHVSAPIEAAYSSVHMWARAVSTADTTDFTVVRRTLRNLVYDGPSEVVRIDPQNNHAWKPFRLAQFGAQNHLKIVSSSEKPLPPEPFPLTRTRTQWEALAESFFQQWGNSWVNPRKPKLLDAGSR